MKLRHLACVGAVLALCVFGGWQQASAGPGVFAGASIPVGDVGNVWKTGYHLGAQYSYPLTPMASVGLLGAYHRLAPDTGDGHANLVEVLAVGKLHPPLGFFVLGGIGFTHSSTTVGTVSGSGTDFTAAAGLGFALMPLEITGLYHNVSTSGSSSSFITVSAGVGF